MVAQPASTRAAHVAVVIPCYKVARHIDQVLRGIPAWVRTIVCVDDCSPDHSSAVIEAQDDPRILLLRHERNHGVGAALATGYRECLRAGADIIVKMDGDDQMDPAYLPALIEPLLRAEADYAKGNRWSDPEHLVQMPALRRFGNLGLSFAVKACSGYWDIFDPCNGYTAIRGPVLAKIPLQRLAKDYFFETSMLIELNVRRAVVRDVAIPARYGDETSSLRIGRILRRFPFALARGLLYRIWQRHFVRDFGPFAAFLCCGLLFFTWSIVFGGYHWLQSLWHQTPASAGTVMLAALPFLMSFQLLLQAAVLEMTQRQTRALCHEEPLEMPGAVEPAQKRAA